MDQIISSNIPLELDAKGEIILPKMALDATTLFQLASYIKIIENAALEAGDVADAITLRLIECSLVYQGHLLAAHGSVIEIFPATSVDPKTKN